MAYQGPEKRQFERYDTDLRIQFRVNFDLRTKVDYRVREKDTGSYSPETHSGLSCNVSAEGMCFSSGIQLSLEDQVLMDVYIPSVTAPVRMEGAVRWSELQEKKKQGDQDVYLTGIKITRVNDIEVSRSIHVDDEHHVVWSALLESVFGKFKDSLLRMRPSS